MDGSAAVSNGWAEALRAEQVLPRFEKSAAELWGSVHQLELGHLAYKLLRAVIRSALGSRLVRVQSCFHQRQLHRGLELSTDLYM